MTELLKTIQDSQVVYRLGWALLHTLWLGTIVGLAFAAAGRLLRRRSANARYLAGCTALALMVALPVGAFLCVPPPPPASPEAPAAVTLLATPEPEKDLRDIRDLKDGKDTEPTPASSSLPVPPPNSSVSFPPSSLSALRDLRGESLPSSAWSSRAAQALQPALPWIVLTWLAGVFGLSLWQLAGWMAAARLKRLAIRPHQPGLADLAASLAQAMGVRRAVRVLESAIIRVPTVVGWLRPVILVPLGLAAGLSPAQLQAVLAHELAHVRRYDYLVNLLQSLVETLLFYHPAVWLISRRLRLEREHCCDDIVVASGAERLSYAETLLQLCEHQSSSGSLARLPSPGVALAGPASSASSASSTKRPSHLRLRVRRLLGLPELVSHFSNARSALAALLVVLALALTVTLHVRAGAGDTSAPAARKPADSQAAETPHKGTLVKADQLPPLPGTPWGPATEAVQARLTCDKLIWTPKETPAFRIDMRNLGKDSWSFPEKTEGMYLELDGDLYEWAGPVDNPAQTAGPGAAMSGIPLVLDRHWARKGASSGKLSLDGGKHSVRVKVTSYDDARRFGDDGVDVTSNRVDFWVLPADQQARMTKRAKEYRHAKVTVRVGPDGRHIPGEGWSVQVAGQEGLTELLSFFPDLGRKSDTAAGWIAGATVELTKADGKLVRIAVSGNDRLKTWSAGAGDWDVCGDFAAYLNKLRPSAPSTRPEPGTAAVGRNVKDFPEKTDLSTPESAMAAYLRALAGKDAQAVAELGWAKMSPADLRNIEESLRRDTADMAVFRQAMRNAQIVEVLTYRDDLACVVAQLKFPEGVGREPFSIRSFGRIEGVWKNLGEDRVADLAEARRDFETKKDVLWASFQAVRAQVSGAAPVPAAATMPDPATTAADGGYVFGPVVERTINPTDRQHGRFLDLDTGNLLDAPDPKLVREVSEVADLKAWAARTGVDLLAEDVPVGIQLAVVPRPDSREWDKPLPAQLIRVLEQSEGGTPAVMMPGKELPSTWYFKTREGGMGVLQLVGYVEKKEPGQPRGFKIRYKLLHPAPAEPGKEIVQRTYDVRDLLAAGERYESPMLGWTTGDDASGGGVTSDNGQGLIGTIRKTIVPDSWNDPRAKIEMMRGQFIVTQRREVHGELVKALARMRALAHVDKPIQVDCKFVTVPAGETGPWDFLVKEAKAAFTQGPDGVQTATISSRQAEAFLARTQAGKGCGVQSTPRLMLISGQRNYALIHTSTAILVPSVEGVRNPRMYFQSGVLLEVQATLVPGRDEVKVQAAPSMARLLDQAAPEQADYAQASVTAQVPAGRWLILKLPVQRRQLAEVRKASPAEGAPPRMPWPEAVEKDVAGPAQPPLYVLIQPQVVQRKEPAGQTGKEIVQRTYDVRDLLAAGVSFEAPPIGWSRGDESGVRTVEGGEKLMAAVRKTVAPDSWNDPRAKIEVLRGQLIVTQKREVHDELVKALVGMRALAQVDKAIAIHCKFVTVPAAETALWDALIQEANPALAQGPDGVQTARISQQQAEAFIARTQGKDYRILAAPRVMLMSGQRSFASIGTSMAAKVPGLEGAPESLVYFQSGLFLDVQATLVEPGNEVRVRAAPSMASLDDKVKPMQADYARANVTVQVPAGRWLILKLPVQRRQLAGVRMVKDAATGQPRPEAVEKDVAGPPRPPLYVLIQPQVVERKEPAPLFPPPTQPAPGGESDVDRALRQKLYGTQVAMDFEGQEASFVFDYLREKMDVPMHVKWRELQRVGIQGKTRVDVRVKAVPALTALKVFLDNLSGDDRRLAFVIEDGLVFVSTTADLKAARQSRPFLGAAPDDASKAVMEKLRKPVQMEFEGQELSFVFDYLRENTNVPLHVKWRELEKAGIPGKTQVDVRLKRVPALTAFKALLADVSGVDKRMAFVIEDGVVTVSTAEDLKGRPGKGNEPAAGPATAEALETRIAALLDRYHALAEQRARTPEADRAGIDKQLDETRGEILRLREGVEAIWDARAGQRVTLEGYAVRGKDGVHWQPLKDTYPYSLRLGGALPDLRAGQKVPVRVTGVFQVDKHTVTQEEVEQYQRDLARAKAGQIQMQMGGEGPRAGQVVRKLSLAGAVVTVLPAAARPTEAKEPVAK